MFKVSEKAREKIKEFFTETGDVSPIRIHVSGSG